MKKVGTYNNVNLYINNKYYPLNFINMSRDSCITNIVYNGELMLYPTKKLVYPLTHSIPSPYQMSYIRNYNLI